MFEERTGQVGMTADAAGALADLAGRDIQIVRGEVGPPGRVAVRWPQRYSTGLSSGA